MAVLRLVAVVMIASLLSACGGNGVPPAANYGTVKGIVTDRQTGTAIAGAVVTINSIQAATTGKDGSYSVYPVPVGAFEWVTSASGYQTQQGSDNVDPGATKTLNFYMLK